MLGMMLSVVLAAATQRITGLGFALVSAPLLVLASGPITGVLLANLLSLITNLAVLAQTWRQVDLRRVLLLAVPALCFVPVGQFVARLLSPAVLMVGIGGLVLAALAAVRLLQRTVVFSGKGGAIAAGALSGFMNVTAGVGGPAMALYALASKWPHRSFVGWITADREPSQPTDKAVVRGTVFHERRTGEAATVFVDDGHILLRVSCLYRARFFGHKVELKRRR